MLLEVAGLVPTEQSRVVRQVRHVQTCRMVRHRRCLEVGHSTRLRPDILLRIVNGDVLRLRGGDGHQLRISIHRLIGLAHLHTEVAMVHWVQQSQAELVHRCVS